MPEKTFKSSDNIQVPTVAARDTSADGVEILGAVLSSSYCLLR